MTAAIFGLIGVVIGGALNLIGLWVLETRRDRRGTQVAARLLIPDLQECKDALFIAQGDTTWVMVVVPNTRWKTQEERLARGITNADDWSTVMETFLNLERLSNEADTSHPTARFTEEDKAFIEETQAQIRAALDVLRDYAGLDERHVNVKRRP